MLTAGEGWGDFMEFKIVDDFLPKEELEKLDNRDFSEDIREAMTNGRVIVLNGNWNETVKAVNAKMVKFPYTVEGGLN